MSCQVTHRFTEMNHVTPIVPASRQDATVSTAYLSMQDYARAIALINIGAIATNGTVNAKLRQAKDSSGSAVKDVTGKAITQLTDADDNKIVAIELRAEELDVAGGFDHVKLDITVAGTAAVLCSAELVRTVPRYAPVGTTQYDEVVD